MTHPPVFKNDLVHLSNKPLTGYTRSGYCEVPASDFGNHAIAAELTQEFLDYTEAQGNPLQTMGGLKPGCKWCLCAGRWLEAFSARKSDTDPIVPRVFLDSTNEAALKKVEFEDLKKFAADAKFTDGS